MQRNRNDTFIDHTDSGQLCWLWINLSPEQIHALKTDVDSKHNEIPVSLSNKELWREAGELHLTKDQPAE